MDIAYKFTVYSDYKRYTCYGIHALLELELE